VMLEATRLGVGLSDRCDLRTSGVYSNALKGKGSPSHDRAED